MPPIPQADYFIARAIIDVVPQGTDGWGLVFEGGSMIVVEDENYPRPDPIVIGYALTSVEDETENIVLCFGKTPRTPEEQQNYNPCAISMTINKMTYGIADEAYTGGEVVYPDRQVIDLETPPDPSNERTVEPEAPLEAHLRPAEGSPEVETGG